MTYRTWNLAAACVALGVFTSSPQALAQVTYVDALGGFGGNTLRASNLSPDDWFNTAAANNNLWFFRADQGNAGAYQSVDSSTYVEDAPELVTTATGLADGTYDVYAFYRSEGAGTNVNNWKVRAGFTSNPGANPIYDRTGATGTAGTLALSGPGALTFAGTPPAEDAQQLLYYAVIGQYTVTDGNLSVFIDDLPGASPTQLNNRTWYEGIGYALPTVTGEINSVQTGNAQLASTWSNNQPPSSANNYNVVASHVVTVDDDFAGKRLTAQTGGTVNIGASLADIRYLKVDAGGTLTESVSGSWTLGDQFASLSLGFLELENDVTFTADPGEQLTLALSLLGTQDLEYVSNGAGSELIIADAQDHDGTIRFSGTGDAVRMVHNRLFGRVEMNSTGANRFVFETTDQVGNGVLIFNEEGVVDHASSVAGSRLIQPSVLEANAPVTVDLTKTFTGDERRLSFADAIRGGADITVNGTATDPFNPGGGSNGTTLNEFELGGTGEPSGNIVNNSYSGTLTANDYVNVELRHGLPSARVVVNANAMLDTGHQVVNTAKAIELGEVAVNSGGTLEVGFTQSTDGGAGTGHHVSHLVLDDSSGRAGTLTLAGGATTVMQVNGLDFTQHDTIEADGTITLDGTLRVLVNPLSTNATANPVYNPTLGDAITLMSSTGGEAPATDFNNSGTVDGVDLQDWRTSFVQAINVGDADGDGDTDGNDFLAWQQDVGATGSGSGVAGSFDSFVVDDPGNFLSNAGLAFQLQITSSEVNLVVVAAGAIAAVPEPTAALLGAAGALGLAAARRRAPRKG